MSYNFLFSWGLLLFKVWVSINIFFKILFLLLYVLPGLQLVFFPLVGFISLYFLEFFFGKKIVIYFLPYFYSFMFIVGVILIQFVFTFFLSFYYILAVWINCGLIVINWGFLFDTLSVSMLSMVSIVSYSVHIYSLDYMKSDLMLTRFLSYLSLFTFFMFILVSGNNLVQLFLGWEGIGLCSYLLISFWNTRVQANKASIKALIMNRVGDACFLLGIILLFFLFRSFDFSIIFSLIPYFQESYFNILNFKFKILDLICLFLFFGSMGKSAQIGLHTWLPDAMEGPTPVSALIHAATLVTAGVFLIIRCSPLFEFSSIILLFIMLIGGITAFFSATVAITQDDIKKVIAYSTCSQLGYMIFICGLSEYQISLFHLINHAFFKALLFLSAGSIIHGVLGEQDVRRFGKLIKLIPFTYMMMLLGFFALSGFPFLSGFYSKDLILEVSFSKYFIEGIFSYFIGSVSAGLTAFYSFRILYYSFWTETQLFKYSIQKIDELSYNMGCSLSILALGSMFSGYLFKDIFIGFGNLIWTNSIYQDSYNTIGVDQEFIPLIVKNVPLIFSFFGLLLSIIFNNLILYFNNFIKINFQNSSFYKNNIIFIYWFFFKKWYWDYVYNYYIGYSILNYSYEYCYKLIDKGIIELFNKFILEKFVYRSSFNIGLTQLGIVYHLFFFLFMGLFLLIINILIF